MVVAGSYAGRDKFAIRLNRDSLWDAGVGT
jgi:hypothetical protein